MAWDIQVDSLTGDLMFSPIRDLAGVAGSDLLKQRISLRCKIPQGSWIYGDDSLGSTLHLTHNTPALGQPESVRGAISDALAPMSDEIQVTSIDVFKTEQNQLQAEILFHPVITEPDVPTVDDPSFPPDVDAISINIPSD